MAILWVDGFDSSIHETPIGRLYTYSAAAGTPTNGDPAQAAAGQSFSAYDITLTTPVLIGSPATTMCVGFAFRSASNTAINNGATVPFVAFRNSDGEQLRFEFVDDTTESGKTGGTYFRIRVVRGSTTLATSNEKFYWANLDVTWNYFEFKAVIDDSTGSFEGTYRSLRMGRSGTLTWSAANTNVDTQEQSSAGADRVRFSLTSGVANQRMLLDDVYVTDDDFLGRVVVVAQKPSSAGATQQWVLEGGAATVQAALSENAITAPNDDSRVTSQIEDDVCLVSVGATAALDDVTILALRKDLHYRMDSGSSGDLSHEWRKTTGTPAQTNTDPISVTSGAWAANTVIKETDPNTSSPWVKADVDSYQHGVRNDTA